MQTVKFFLIDDVSSSAGKNNFLCFGFFFLILLLQHLFGVYANKHFYF